MWDMNDFYRHYIQYRLHQEFQRQENEAFFGTDIYRYLDAIEVTGRIVDRDESRALIVWSGKESI